MSPQNNTEAAKAALEFARIRNDAYIEALQRQRNNAQDQVAALGAEVATLRKQLEISREKEHLLSTEVSRLSSQAVQLGTELVAVKEQQTAQRTTRRKSRPQQG